MHEDLQAVRLALQLRLRALAASQRPLAGFRHDLGWRPRPWCGRLHRGGLRDVFVHRRLVRCARLDACAACAVLSGALHAMQRVKPNDERGWRGRRWRWLVANDWLRHSCPDVVPDE